MADGHNSAQPSGREAATSTTEEALRLFREQRKTTNGDDVVNNPELEQLVGSLLKGLDEDIADNAPEDQAAGRLTLEDLAAGPALPLTLGEIPFSQPDGAAAVPCSACGSANPAGTAFCGACGQKLAKSAGATKVAGNGTDSAAQVVPKAVVTQLAATVGMSSSRVLKIAFLTLCCMVLGLVVYERQLWREPLLAQWMSSLRGMLSAESSVAAPPEPAEAPAHPAAAPLQTPVIRQPSTPAKPRKTAPPTTIRHPLPEPALLDLPVPQLAELPPPIAVPDTAASAAKTPVATAPEPVKVVPAPTRPAPVKVSQGVVQGALVSKVNPDYPRVARAARIQGSVVMHAIIGTDGTVQQLQVISGNPLLVGAALEAVKKWRYRPYLLDGIPAEVETTITVNFKGE
jgi:protein TonB